MRRQRRWRTSVDVVGASGGRWTPSPRASADEPHPGRSLSAAGDVNRRTYGAAGGVSVAYVFVHLHLGLAAGQATIDGPGLEEGERAPPGQMLEFLEHHVYLVALVGLVTTAPPVKHPG